MFIKILELYSGIGGMHCALKESKIPGKVIAAVDINTVANEVYKHNFSDTNLLNRNIQAISLYEIENLEVNTILMSPPCQPFTRNGNLLDEKDARTESFLYIINILPKLDSIQYILMENVKGFEHSCVRNLFIEKLEQCNFVYQEFLLCPSSFGVPNSRLRYYCIARKQPNWNFKRKDEVITRLSHNYESPYLLETILEENISTKFLLPDKLLKRANILDICYKDSNRSCCFTKAYAHYVEGTGSVYTDVNHEEVKQCFDKANTFEVGSQHFIDTVKTLNLRFFTPKEILALMAFPKDYTFPPNITMKQCYRLLGNSVNVKVISELLKILFDK